MISGCMSYFLDGVHDFWMEGQRATNAEVDTGHLSTLGMRQGNWQLTDSHLGRP